MEEFVGKIWHRWATGVAVRHYPEAAVTLTEVEKTAGILFRAFGGDPGLKVAAATTETHGAHRRLMQRIAGSGDKATLARLDADTLRLPSEIAIFSERSLNRDLYFWLAALAACDEAPQLPWHLRNQRATQATLRHFPGLKPRYQRLLAAHLASRIEPQAMADDEAAQENALRQALCKPGSLALLPPLFHRESRPPQPIPLWLAAPPGNVARTDAATDANLPGEGSGNDSATSPAYKAEQVTVPKNDSPFLLIFRAESLLSWGEYVRINRAFDEDDDPLAAEAAKDMDQLAITRDAKTRVSRVKFDLDLPSAAEDDQPVGPGIPLPEWDYRMGELLPDHCRLQPMIAADAQPAKLPDALKKTAHRLRQQFAALAPARHWLKAQQDGPELDIDNCVRNIADQASGHTPDHGAYLAQARCERDLACLLLADLSLSTDNWVSDSHRIIDVIRESLLLFAEAMSATGDRFGLYGFSSLKRHNVRFNLIKDFSTPYNAQCRGRILALRPGYYTRIGAALRQASRILVEQPAARRLLLLISDGKPNDLDLYDSRYGVEDTRMAIHEARRMGLQPFCVTVDRAGGAYLPYIFGPAGFTVIRKPEDLPARLPLLYAQLTRG
ncbi:VWA domain-containing protein [Propionivibrio sp.]|uniref:nitric oxide reductase activation protein NorD n=1 Tax=Propionivibrio sp. TaxID=2212460 RepID=UPI0026288778|nr:VWA domain-containing protein [Propionivibrio sp.]